MANASSILDQSHLDAINTELARETQIRAEFALAQRAGLDFSDKLKQYDDAINKLKALKAVYFPNG